MSKYFIQEEPLVAIADAIREKTETTDLLTLDGMVAAIAGISGGAKMEIGTFTLTEDTNGYTVNHNLGATPDIVYIWCKSGQWTPTDAKKYVLCGINYSYELMPTRCGISTIINDNKTPYTYGERTDIPSLNEEILSTRKYPNACPYNATSTSFIIGGSKDNVYLAGGKVYNWIAVARVKK